MFVRWGSKKSNLTQFLVASGVIPGGIISPIKFDITKLDDLIMALNSSSIRCTVELFFNCLCYADDLCLIMVWYHFI